MTEITQQFQLINQILFAICLKWLAVFIAEKITPPDFITPKTPTEMFVKMRCAFLFCLTTSQ